MAEVDVEEFRCFVGGLAWATTDTALADAFKSYGDVIESKVINDRETGRSRGFGFVTFRDEKSMKDAIESMNGMELDGRNITVHQAQQRPTNNSGGFNKNNGRGNERGNYGSERGSERGNYGTERGSERGNYGTERGNERGNYGSERGNFGRRTEGGNFGRRYGGARSDGRSDVDNWRKAD